MDLVSCTIQDLRIFSAVADSLKKSGLACICSSHNENSKAPDLLSNVLRLHIMYIQLLQSIELLAAGES